MKHRLSLILFLFLPLLGGLGGSVLLAQDFARMGERTIMGTARYVGMSGAMSAIGGDPSAVLDNNAGLGLYRRAELMATFDLKIDKTWQHENAQNTSSMNWLLMCPHASLVFSIPTHNPTEKGILFNNFMFSYHRRNCFDRAYRAQGGSDASLGALLPALDIPFCTDARNTANALNLSELGYVNEYTFNWAMNISNQWYIGAGIHVHSMELSASARYSETFGQQDANGDNNYINNNTKLRYYGSGCALSAGLLYRPLKWLRLGMGVQTPSLGSLNINSSGELWALTDSLRASYAPDMSSRVQNFHMPLHLSSSVAFQIGAYGMVALQHDYYHQSYALPRHSFRVGMEVVPVMGLYVNAGYAYESTFKEAQIVPLDPTFDRQDTYFIHTQRTQYASLAVGYRGPYMIVQLAYQFRWQTLGLYAHEAAEPYDINANTHRIVFSIGWHQN